MNYFNRLNTGIRQLALVTMLTTSVGALQFVTATDTWSEPRHGLSIFGDLKYPVDFKHFNYVNPDAPKGGRMVTMGTGGATTYDSFNAYILKGDAAQGLEFLFDTLMVRAFDEPDAVYGLIAKTADIADDGMSVTFELREEAKFSDGTPVTAEDVAASFKLLKEKGHPAYAMPLRDVTGAEVIDPHTIRFDFEGNLTRDLPVNVASIPVFSKAFYDKNPFDKTTLTPPLGSGPYKISDHSPGSSLTYSRREDYWAKDLPVNRGRYNFDDIRYDYYRDRNIELENLKAGQFDYREEFTSISWATAYDIPAVRDGRLVKEILPDKRPSGAQGYFINTRREKFQDPRVRKALALVFDFEWSNRKLFYGLYKRTTSYFENSDMKATGKPGPDELALLETFRDQLNPEVFEEPFIPPVTDGSGNNREQLKKARDLLAEAGWKFGRETEEDSDCGFFCGFMKTVGLKSEPSKLVARNAKGETLDVEILEFEPSFERVTGPYVRNLRRIGVNAYIRRVEPAQYQRRMKSFDFDMTTQRYALRLTPGVELRTYWGSQSAKLDGSFNLAGIQNPVIDKLIDKIMAAESRDELTTATKAVDRLLRAGHYWVPHWYKASHSIAYWNKFSRPETKPKYDPGVLDTWWYDEDKAKALLAAGGQKAGSG